MESTANGVVVPQIEQQNQQQQQPQQKPKKKAKNNNKKLQLTTNITTTTTITKGISNQETKTVASNGCKQSVETNKEECKSSVNGIVNKLKDVHISRNGIGKEHHMSNGSYVDTKHKNLNGHAKSTTSNHNINDKQNINNINNNDDGIEVASTTRKTINKSKLKSNNNNNNINKNQKKTNQNLHCQEEQQPPQQQHTENGLVENGYDFSKTDIITTKCEKLLNDEASYSGNNSCNISSNSSSSNSSSSCCCSSNINAVERLVNVNTATPTVLTAITAKLNANNDNDNHHVVVVVDNDNNNNDNHNVVDVKAFIEKNQNQNNNISEKTKTLSSPLATIENADEAENVASCVDSVNTIVPALDKSKVHIKYTEYQSELQMHDIMRLIQAELSEPYSIYTYRYFIYNWPKLCFLAAHDNEYVGAIVCKLDMHMNVKRGYIAMLAVRKEYRNLKIGTTLVQMAIDAMLADNADEVVLETEMRNYPALHLYENLGFVRDKRLFRYYLNGVDALRLKLWFR